MVEVLIYSSRPHLLLDEARIDVFLVRCGCPGRHVLAEIPVVEWADSPWRGRLTDLMFMVDCELQDCD